MFGLLSYFLLSMFFNFCFVQSFSLPYVNFADAISDQALMHQLRRHPGRVHKKHKTPRISKILRFQMDRILRLHNRHMDQGNMSRSHRAEFERKPKLKFDRIKSYSKKRLRKDYADKIRSRRFQNLTNQWFKIFQKQNAPISYLLSFYCGKNFYLHFKIQISLTHETI